METRFLGASGLRVSVLSLGTMTFGDSASGSRVGTVGLEQARRFVDRCLDAGMNLFDTADVYSQGVSEEMLGQALGARRQDVHIATKGYFRRGDGPNDLGASRYHIVRACEASLLRLGTEYVDLYQLHGFDACTPLEETLRALDDLIQAGKVLYLGCSNYSAWHLMKALGISERLTLERFVSQQVYYSLVAREVEHELVPLGLDQGVGILVWSPLAGGLLSGKYRRGETPPEGTRLAFATPLGTVDQERAFGILDVLHEIASQRGVSVSQVSLNWLLRKPGVTSVVIGARTEEQLADNLGAATWELGDDELAHLDEVSTVPPIYPYWHQQSGGSERSQYPCR